MKSWLGRRSGKVPQSMGPIKRKTRVLGKGKYMQDDQRNCGRMAREEASGVERVQMSSGSFVWSWGR